MSRYARVSGVRENDRAEDLELPNQSSGGLNLLENLNKCRQIQRITT
jgi:hypothetical protein